MRKLISLIIITLLLCIFTTGTFASNTDTNKNCVIIIVNNTNNVYTFRLSWIDHPFLYQTDGKPWHKTGGELLPKEPFVPTSKQAPGLYTVTYWKQWPSNEADIIKNFTITAKNKKIIIALIPGANKPPILLIFKYDK
jgi:hypothetical protein